MLPFARFFVLTMFQWYTGVISHGPCNQRSIGSIEIVITDIVRSLYIDAKDQPVLTFENCAKKHLSECDSHALTIRSRGE